MTLMNVFHGFEKCHFLLPTPTLLFYYLLPLRISSEGPHPTISFVKGHISQSLCLSSCNLPISFVIQYYCLLKSFYCFLVCFLSFSFTSALFIGSALSETNSTPVSLYSNRFPTFQCIQMDRQTDVNNAF